MALPKRGRPGDGGSPIENWDHTYSAAHDVRTGDEYLKAVQRNKMAASIIMTSQGMPFMQAGEEFARHKSGDSNSYNSPTSTNWLDWQRTIDYKDILDYYKGMIAIRNSFSPLRTAESGLSYGSWGFGEPGTDNSLLGLSYTNPNPGGAEWDWLAVLVNPTGNDANIPMQARTNDPNFPTEWVVIADGEKAGTVQIGVVTGTRTIVGVGAQARQQLTLDSDVPSYSTMILVDKASYDRFNAITNGTVRVRHLNKANNESVAQEDTITQKIGTTYHAQPRKIAGYALDNNPVERIGSVSAGETIVTYYYEEIAPGGAETYTTTVIVNKNSDKWENHGKEFALKLASDTSITVAVDSDGTAQVGRGIWKVYEGNTDTGRTIIVNNTSRSLTLDYFSVAFDSSDTTIDAVYDGATILNDNIVLSGKRLVLTANVGGAGPFAFGWSGTTSGQNASLVMPVLVTQVIAFVTVCDAPSTWNAGSKATCTTASTRQKICLRDSCHHIIESEDVDSLDHVGHGYDGTGVSANPRANCTTNQVCAREGCNFVTEAKLGHDMSASGICQRSGCNYTEKRSVTVKPKQSPQVVAQEPPQETPQEIPAEGEGNVGSVRTGTRSTPALPILAPQEEDDDGSDHTETQPVPDEPVLPKETPQEVDDNGGLTDEIPSEVKQSETLTTTQYSSQPGTARRPLLWGFIAGAAFGIIGVAAFIGWSWWNKKKGTK